MIAEADIRFAGAQHRGGLSLAHENIMRTREAARNKKADAGLLLAKLRPSYSPPLETKANGELAMPLSVQRPKNGVGLRLYRDGRIGVAFINGPDEVVARLSVLEAEGFREELDKIIAIAKRGPLLPAHPTPQ